MSNNEVPEFIPEHLITEDEQDRYHAMLELISLPDQEDTPVEHRVPLEVLAKSGVVGGIDAVGFGSSGPIIRVQIPGKDGILPFTVMSGVREPEVSTLPLEQPPLSDPYDDEWPPFRK